MGKYYDDRVEFAIRYLWQELHTGKAKTAVSKLEEAVKDGDADACYFLGRCYCGPCYVDADCGVEEDEVKARGYFNMSLERGSAIGMFATRRLGGFHPIGGTYVHEPYHSEREIWDAVYAIAQKGDPFAQYLIGNAYYFGDEVEFSGLDWDSLSDKERYEIRREQYLKAIPYLEQAIANGISFGVGNLINIVSSGEYDIPKDEKKEKELIRRGAELGRGYYEYLLGKDYEKNHDYDQALFWYERSSSHGEENGSVSLGKFYTYHGIMPQDLWKAKGYFELSLKQEPDCIAGHNRLGEIYFYGGEGIEPDYEKAVYHLERAGELDNNWGSDMLGTCYLRGLGTAVDYEKAKEQFEQYTGERLSAIGLGEIYAYGLGVAVDIKKAMSYWDKFPTDASVMQNKKKFRKTLFGWKRIEE